MKPHSFAMEHLEGRTLFSVVAPTDATLVAGTDELQPVFQSTTVSHPFPAAFNVAGTFIHTLSNPDTPSQYKFTGAGNTNTLGKFALTGRVQPPGFIANAHASGILVITTSKGTIHLSVIGPLQGPGVLPSSLSFKIFRGTGSYVHSTGKGKIVVSASGTTHKFLFRFQPAT